MPSLSTMVTLDSTLLILEKPLMVILVMALLPVLLLEDLEADIKSSTSPSTLQVTENEIIEINQVYRTSLQSAIS